MTLPDKPSVGYGQNQLFQPVPADYFNQKTTRKFLVVG